MKQFSRINKILVTLVILLATTFSFAQNTQANTSEADELFGGVERGEGKIHHRRGELIKALIAEKLGLTDTQKAQIKQIRQSHKDAIKPLVQELRAKRQEIHQAFEGEVYNESLATQKISETSALKAKLLGEKFKMRKEILAVLTPEQKTKLEQLKEEFKARRGEKMRFRNL